MMNLLLIVLAFGLGSPVLAQTKTNQKPARTQPKGVDKKFLDKKEASGAGFYEDVGSSTAIREKVIMGPIHKKGLNLNQIASCLVIDQIPWVSRKTNRKSRLLAHDTMRLNIHKNFSKWEIHQVMDKEGYISFIFRRKMKGGKVESIVTKENHYNRFIDFGTKRKVVQVENYINLIDRAAMIFYAENGNRVEFRPGFAGQTTLIIYYTGQTSPVYLQDLKCGRGDSEGGSPFPNSGGGNTSGESAAPAASSGK